MQILVLRVGSCALASLVLIAGCSGSEFSAAHGAGTGTGGQNGSGGSSAGGGGIGNGGKVGAGGKGAGGRGAGGTGTAGTSGGGGTGTGGTGSGGVSAGGTLGSGGAGTGGSGGTVTNSGDCRLDHGDCGTNSRCVEVTPGGYRVCTVPYPEATTCNGMGQCCKTSDCPGGSICYPAPLAPYCGGIIAIDSNVCGSDMCKSDADCGTESICVPAGTMDRKVRMCVPHSCHLDTDCTAAQGGICAPVSGGCCGGVMGLYCVYPGIGCRQNKDCPSGNCEVDSNGASRCATGPAVCPL